MEGSKENRITSLVTITGNLLKKQLRQTKNLKADLKNQLRTFKNGPEASLLRKHLILPNQRDTAILMST